VNKLIEQNYFDKEGVVLQFGGRDLYNFRQALNEVIHCIATAWKGVRAIERLLLQCCD
jgi:hypothetical protein